MGEGGWALSGTAVFAHEGVPCKLGYRVLCAPDWRTTSANVGGRIGGREIELSVDQERRWQLDGVDCPVVAGCLDLELGFSPSTNLLPIRRLSLAVGESAEVRAAWLPFPALTFRPLPQVYRREGETRYRYESLNGEFVRVLEVNGAGFVTSYPGLWHIESAT